MPRVCVLSTGSKCRRCPQAPAAAGNPTRTEGPFLLDDATFLRLRFTGYSASTESGQAAFDAERLEGVGVRGVVRDHDVAEVAEVLLQGIARRTSRRRAQLCDAQAHLERLQSLRILLRR
jgi:hypothetical protein